MIDFLALVIGSFLICFLILILIVGLTLLHRILNLKIPKPTKSNAEQKDEQIKQDSEGHGLFFDDPLFPEEPDEE